MVDLKNPLEGVPGLLLMAALIFFGATIGIGVALVFTWIPMSDALANFLGGVVGAGLGAALAVMGAVYVQRRERADRFAGALNALRKALRDLTARIDVTIGVVEAALRTRKRRSDFKLPLERLFRGIEEAVKQLPEGTELPTALHETVLRTKESLEVFCFTMQVSREALDKEESEIIEDGDDGGLSVLRQAADAVAKCSEQLASFRP